MSDSLVVADASQAGNHHGDQLGHLDNFLSTFLRMYGIVVCLIVLSSVFIGFHWMYIYICLTLPSCMAQENKCLIAVAFGLVFLSNRLSAVS